MLGAILEMIVTGIAIYLAMVAVSIAQVITTGVPLLMLFALFQGYRKIKRAIIRYIDQ
jgi:hypothetical protein